MKILVISDSHGAKSEIYKAAKIEKPDYILHLGDNDRDCSVLSEKFPGIPVRLVKGNCDGFSKNSGTDGFTLNDRKILMTHGHYFYVKSSLIKLKKYANEQKPDIVLFGHTHIPYQELWNDIIFINPGSIGIGSTKTYVVLMLNTEINYKFKTLFESL